MKKNLLVASYTGYKTVDKVQGFIESFNFVRRPGEQVCIIYDEQSEINDFLDQYEFVTQVRKPKASENAYANRFKHFAELIDQSLGHDNFICADIRDVHFQLNPFEWMEKNLKKSVVVCDEGVKHSSTNGGIFTLNQVRDGFPDYAQSILKKNVINVGVIGGGKRVAHLCQRVFDMCETVEPKIHSYGSYAFDQAAMGILCHLTEERAFTHHSDGNETWCLTMSTSPESMPHIWIIDNQLCNPNKEPYAIVHQAERHDSFLRYKGQGKFEIFKGNEVWHTAIINGADYKE